MTGDSSMFIDFYHKDYNHITYGDNNKGKFLWEGVMRNPSIIIVDVVLLVIGLKHNLFNISQYYDKGYSIFFLPWVSQLSISLMRNCA